MSEIATGTTRTAGITANAYGLEADPRAHRRVDGQAEGEPDRETEESAGVLAEVQRVRWQTSSARNYKAMIYLVAGINPGPHIALSISWPTPNSQGQKVAWFQVRACLRWYTRRTGSDVVLSALAILKGKRFLGLIGIFIPLTPLVGALRLASPDSPWARRFYGPDGPRLVRARARWKRIDARRRPGTDAIAGAPSGPDLAVVSIRRPTNARVPVVSDAANSSGLCAAPAVRRLAFVRRLISRPGGCTRTPAGALGTLVAAVWWVAAPADAAATRGAGATGRPRKQTPCVNPCGVWRVERRG